MSVAMGSFSITVEYGALVVCIEDDNDRDYLYFCLLSRHLGCPLVCCFTHCLGPWWWRVVVFCCLLDKTDFNSVTV